MLADRQKEEICLKVRLEGWSRNRARTLHPEHGEHDPRSYGHGTVNAALAWLDALSKPEAAHRLRNPKVRRFYGDKYECKLDKEFPSEDVKKAIRNWIGELWIPEVRDLPEDIGDVGRHELWVAGRPFCWVVPGTVLFKPYSAPQFADIESSIEQNVGFALIRESIEDQNIWDLYEQWNFIAGMYLRDGIEFRFEEKLFYANPDGVLNEQPIRSLRSRIDQIQYELVDKLKARLD